MLRKRAKPCLSLDLFNSFRGQEGSWCSLGSASLLTQECPDRAALTAPSSTETHGGIFCYLSSVLLRETFLIQESVSTSCCF